MLRLIFVFCFTFLLSISGYTQSRYWIASVASDWSSDNWASTSGGAPDGGGPPTGLENAIFDGNGIANCNVDITASFSGLVVNNYTGVIDINGNSFTTAGTVTLNSGTINDTPGTSELTINSTGVATFNGTTLGADVNCSADGIDFEGSTFNGDFVGVKQETLITMVLEEILLMEVSL